MGRATRLVAAMMVILVAPVMLALMIPASDAADEGSISIYADAGDPRTPAPNRFPVHKAIPGAQTNFTIWINNSFSHTQKVTLRITDYAPGWVAYVDSAVFAPQGVLTAAKIRITVPDRQPDSSMDPNADHMFRIEGKGNSTGDTASIIVVVRIEVEIKHTLVMLPTHETDPQLEVYPGQNLYIDLNLMNTGNMKDTYDIRIAEHTTGWDVLFSDGSDISTYPLDHGKYDSEAVPRIMIGISPQATLGSAYSLTFYSTSKAAKLYGEGKSASSVTVQFLIVPTSVVSIRPVSPYYEVREGQDITIDFKAHNSGIGEGIYVPRLSVYKDGSAQMGWRALFNPDSPMTIGIGNTISMKVKATPPIGSTGYYIMDIGGYNQKGEVISGQCYVRIAPRSNITIQSIEGGPFDKDSEIRLLIMVENGGFVPQTAMVELRGVPLSYSFNVTPTNFVVEPARTQMIVVLFETRDGCSPISFTVRASITIPSNAEEGWVIADTAEHDVVIKELPNVAVVSMVAPNRMLDEGEVVPVNVTVRNEGSLAQDTVWIVLYEITFAYSRVEIARENVTLGPGEEVSIWMNFSARPSARSIRAVAMLPNNVREDNVSDNELSREVHVRINNPQPGPDDSGPDVNPAIVIGGIAIAALMVGAMTMLITSDAFQYSLYTIPMPLYSKLRPEHLLGNKLRRRIYVYVQNHPGEHFRAILVNLNLKNGTLAHHLYTLEKEDLIRSHRDGLYRRFYPAGFKIDDSPLDLTPVQRRILEMISRRPGITQKDISQEMKSSTSTINYNIKVLREKRLINIQKEGKFSKLTVREQDT
jgi:DNA-binding MarR family transcriptional regulator